MCGPPYPPAWTRRAAMTGPLSPGGAGVQPAGRVAGRPLRDPLHDSYDERLAQHPQCLSQPRHLRLMARVEHAPHLLLVAPQRLGEPYTRHPGLPQRLRQRCQCDQEAVVRAALRELDRPRGRRESWENGCALDSGAPSRQWSTATTRHCFPSHSCNAGSHLAAFPGFRVLHGSPGGAEDHRCGGCRVPRRTRYGRRRMRVRGVEHA